MVCPCTFINNIVLVVGGFVLLKTLVNVATSAFSRFVKRRSLNKMGEWAVITGASDGIGKAMATEIALKGVNVILIARSQERLNEAAQSIKDAVSSKNVKSEVKTIAVDFSSTDESVYDTIKKETDSYNVGILVNNVGVSYPHAMYYHELSPQMINNLIDINVRSAFKTTHIFYEKMCNLKRGLIVNIASGAATLPCDPLYAGYAGVKAAVESFSRNLQVEAASSNVVVQCHAPLLVVSKLSKARPSAFVPTPKVYAKAALTAMENRMVGDVTISPFWGHELQMFVAQALPLSLWEKIASNMNKTIRIKAMKKAQREMEAKEKQN